MNSICFISLGCPKNQVDSEVMIGSLVDEGYVLNNDPSLSDIIVVNTCSFIEDAKTESIDTILEMAEYKKKGSCRLLIVTGCLPQRYKEKLAASLPEVDLFVGVGDIPKLVELINQHEGKQQVIVNRPSYLYDHTTPRIVTGRRHAAYMKIAEGCFHPCSFCIIPKLRGSFRSRSVESLVFEAKTLLGSGVKELNLIAQDSTAYGRDLGKVVDLGFLLRKLANLSGEKWIRIHYAYPHNFPRSVIAAIKELPDVVKYVDVPIQHINERILKSMCRQGDSSEIRNLIRDLREAVPDITLRTSVIVGYPGETEDEFSELLDFIKEIRFDYLGAFVYSKEEGTIAAKMSDDISREVVDERWHKIMSVQKDISLDKNKEKIGRRMRVLVEGLSDETDYLLVGRHEGQAPDVDGVVYINEGQADSGNFEDVEITEAYEYDLVGRVV